LIVEDDADGREALRSLLELLGHEVEVAENGEQGIELTLAHRPRLCFSTSGCRA
jgi:CheY-like chemotaxis protein